MWQCKHARYVGYVRTEIMQTLKVFVVQTLSRLQSGKFFSTKVFSTAKFPVPAVILQGTMSYTVYIRQ
jgi:hypothetical protein